MRTLLPRRMKRLQYMLVACYTYVYRSSTDTLDGFIGPNFGSHREGDDLQSEREALQIFIAQTSTKARTD